MYFSKNYIVILYIMEGDLPNKIDIINTELDNYIKQQLDLKKDIKDILTDIIKEYTNTKLAVTQCNTDISNMNCTIVYSKYK